MKHLDLFSGIGGFSLAIDRVFGKVEHTFCEIDPFCQEVIKKHWPNSKIHGDIRTFTYTRIKESGRLSHKSREESKQTWEPYILTGGFPCQPFSQAGQRKGTADDRHLWPEMLRVIREFSPRWVVGENVGGFVTWSDGLVLRQVFADLEGEGYEVQAFVIPACAVNAPHRRDRIWIVANSRQQHGSEGGDERMEKNKEVGTARSVDAERQDKNASDSKRTGHTGQEHKERQGAGHSGRIQQQDWNKNWAQVATRLCRVDDGLPRRMDRNSRLKALGNSIVPQVAEEIFKAIKRIEDDKNNNTVPPFNFNSVDDVRRRSEEKLRMENRVV